MENTYILIYVIGKTSDKSKYIWNELDLLYGVIWTQRYFIYINKYIRDEKRGINVLI